MNVTLTDAEQTVLNDVAKVAVTATTAARQAFEAAQKATDQANREGANLEAAINTVLKLKGLDPSRHVASYDTESGQLTIAEDPSAPTPASAEVSAA